jgi:hypothetical protein
MTGPSEIELKLEVPADRIGRLHRKPLLRRIAATDNSAEVISVYFDTANTSCARRACRYGCDALTVVTYRRSRQWSISRSVAPFARLF